MWVPTVSPQKMLNENVPVSDLNFLIAQLISFIVKISKASNPVKQILLKKYYLYKLYIHSYF